MNWTAMMFAAPAWAASAAAGGEPHAAPFSQIIFPVINFLIFFYLLKRFAFPTLKDHLQSRRDAILTEVREAEASRTESEIRLREYRDKISRIREESDQVRQLLREEADKEKTRIVREAEDLASKIHADARFMAEQEVRIARRQLREDMARVAERAAREALSKHRSPADQKKWVEDFVKQIGGAQ